VILSTIARFLNAAVIVYVFLCAARVLMSWLPGLDAGRSGAILARVVDPYLNWFRRFKIFSSGAFDFSPIAALALLAVVNDLLTKISFAINLSVGLVLALVVGAAWSAVAFVVSFFMVCALARMIAYAARWNSLHPLWMVIDSILNPALFRINRLVYRGRIVNYLQGLITGSVFLALMWVVGRLLVGQIVRSLSLLPF
jgi:YggT family protein